MWKNFGNIVRFSSIFWSKKGHCEIKKAFFLLFFFSLYVLLSRKRIYPILWFFQYTQTGGVKVMAQFIISEEQIANRSKNPMILVTNSYHVGWEDFFYRLVVRVWVWVHISLWRFFFFIKLWHLFWRCSTKIAKCWSKIPNLVLILENLSK